MGNVIYIKQWINWGHYYVMAGTTLIGKKTMDYIEALNIAENYNKLFLQGKGKIINTQSKIYRSGK